MAVIERLFTIFSKFTFLGLTISGPPVAGRRLRLRAGARAQAPRIVAPARAESRPWGLRRAGARGQWTMFFRDPSGNSLEFKAMTTPANLFEA